MSQFYAVQTRTGQEHAVIDQIRDSSVPGVYAALAPASMNAYVLVEAEEFRLVEEAVNGVPSVNKVVQGESGFREVKGFLSPGSDISMFSEGDRVEVIAGAYEGEVASVTALQESEEKVTVELVDSPVPVPINLPGDQVRKI